MKVLINFNGLYQNFDKKILGYLKDETANYQDIENYYLNEEQEKYNVLGIGIKLI